MVLVEVLLTSSSPFDGTIHDMPFIRAGMYLVCIVFLPHKKKR